MSVNLDRMAAQLELHEGLKLQVYADTLGNDTLGVGYNVTARGLNGFNRTIGRRIDAAAKPCITAAEARLQLRADIKRIEPGVIAHFPGYLELNEVRQRVVLDLAFNMGFGALAFKQTRAYVEQRDWSGATRQLYKSRWAYQVDDGPGGRYGRADRLGGMLLTGNDYTA